jgi:hypothetical protein
MMAGKQYRPAELPQLPDGEKRFIKGEYTNISDALRSANETLGSLGALAFEDLVSDILLRDSVGLSVIGRSANSTGKPADIVAGTDGHVLRLAGTTLGFGTIVTAGIADDAVTYAKMQNVSATDKVLGRSTAGAGNVEEIACTSFGRSLLDDADAAAGRTTLGVSYGKQSFWVPANAWELGTAARGTYTDGSGHVWPTLDFDQTTLERVYFSVGMPKNWDLGTITAYVYWTAASGTGGVTWLINLGSVQDNESLGDAYSTGTTATDTFQTANNLHISPESGGLIPSSGGESVATHDCLKFIVQRFTSDSGDTLTADARLIGVKFIYNTTSHTDD